MAVSVTELAKYMVRDKVTRRDEATRTNEATRSDRGKKKCCLWSCEEPGHEIREWVSKYHNRADIDHPKIGWENPLDQPQTSEKYTVDSISTRTPKMFPSQLLRSLDNVDFPNLGKRYSFTARSALILRASGVKGEHDAPAYRAL